MKSFLKMFMTSRGKKSELTLSGLGSELLKVNVFAITNHNYLAMNLSRNQFISALTLSLLLISGSCKQNAKYAEMGTYEYDRTFLAENGIEYLELKSIDNQSMILVVPAWQGRVMTSTSGGDRGRSYGWINYALIGSGKTDPQFNAFGGEERFWLGPEGGPFSIYFREGDDQVFENWVVPAVIDTEPYDIESANDNSVRFTRDARLVNSSGTHFDIGIERVVSLISKDDLPSLLGVGLPAGLQVVAYQSNNIVTNRGDRPWNKDGGLLSIWILSMFNPSSETTVFIPYNTEGKGVVVNDEYFGKVPADRLIVDDGVIYFRADGNFRSKIGIPPGRAKEFSGSYDPARGVLTLVWCSLPEEPQLYVNSNWGSQEDPYDGDVINSYNDGPLDDGSIMGPFYELETSSPALALKPGESAGHIQRVMHFEGDRANLSTFVRALLNLDLEEIATRF
jgi:hypothetical protein